MPVASEAEDSVGAMVSYSTVEFDPDNHTSHGACDALSYTDVGELQNAGGAGDINVDFEDTTIIAGGRWKSKKPTMLSMGTMSLEVNYVRSDATQQALVADAQAFTKRVWKITWPDGTKDYYPGYVGSIKRGFMVGKILKGTFTMEPDGEPFFAA